MPTPSTPAGHIPVGALALTEKLRFAASSGQLDKVQELIQAGAGFEPDKDGRTCMHYAAQNGFAEVCKYLAKKNCSLDVQDAIGFTPLHRAAAQGHADVIDVLAFQGCTMNIQDQYGNTAVHEAAWNGYSRSLQTLIKHNASVFIPNKTGFTALHLASQNGHNESLRVLLYASSNTDIKNNYGDTAVHTAARYGHAGVTRILLSARCNLNEQNKNGDTALHIAAALKRRKIAKLLVEGGIDLSVKNKQNESAIDVARRKEHPEIILIITSFSRPRSAARRERAHHKATSPHANVRFKDEIQIDGIEGPIVTPGDQPPLKNDKPEKEKRFFFFKKKKKEKDKGRSSPHPGQGTKSADKEGPAEPWKKPVQGFFSQYVPKSGVQYYRDLAGNIKQGPVGYAPLCQCGPALTKLENKIEENNEKVYDYIDASHQVLKGRIDHLDRQTTQQVYAIDKLTKERLENEHQACHDRITQRLHSEHRDAKSLMTQYNEQIQSWLENKLSSYGHCLDHHHDDSALPPHNLFSDFQEALNGRLFRSRSDETLSQSDYSGKFRKKDFYESRQAAMQQIRGWQIPASKVGAHRRERGNTTVTKAEVHVRESERQADGASPEQLVQSPSSMNRPPGTVPIDIRNIKREQGAIPKRLPTSQSWQSSPTQKLMHSPQSGDSKSQSRESQSREDSPYSSWTQSKMVRSQTDSDDLRNCASSLKPNLPERGPQNLNKQSSAWESPYRNYYASAGQPNKARTLMAYSAENMNLQSPDVSGHRSRSDLSEYGRMLSEKYRTRTLSSDALLETDILYSPNLNRSKSIERTLEEVNCRSIQSTNASPQHGISYRIPSSSDSPVSGTNRNGYKYSVKNGNEKQCSQNVYSNLRESRNSVNLSPVNRYQYKNGWNISEDSEERNYASISQLEKEKHRSMHGLNSENGSRRHVENVVGQQLHSKSENNLLDDGLDHSSRSSPCPSHLPSYPHPSNKSNYNRSLTITGIFTNNTSPAKGYSSPSATSVHNSGELRTNDQKSLNHPDTSGNYSSISGCYVNTSGTYANTSGTYANSFSSVKNSGGYRNDVLNTSSNCLHHESSFSCSTVYNPGYTNTSKENSTCSSNQDSGYSSKAKLPHAENNQNGLPSNSDTPSSSFSIDRSLTDHNLSVSSPSTSHTNSPFSPNKQIDFEQARPRQQQSTILSHINSWYQRKLLEAAEKLRNSDQYKTNSNYLTNVVHYDPVHGSDV